MADKKQQKSRKKAGKKMIAAGIALVCLMACAFLFWKFLFQKETYTYEALEEAVKNPLMGFAPNADYIEAVGDNTLVYVDVTWRELEPQQGQYDFAGIEEENNLERWREEGKNVVFRFVCDVPSDEAHMDIPDWLYEQTGDGTFYDTDYGKGYSPDYSNETFIACHAEAIRVLGEEYGQDSFFAYIELGSIGHWGEWHVKYDAGISRIPSEEVCMEYVTPYLEAFPNAKILMRRPFAAVQTYGMGVYNDMTGDAEDTAEWLNWIEEGGSYEEAETPLALTAVPDIWESAPVGGEFTSGSTMEELLVTGQAETLSLLSESHMTFIGPMCPIACREEEEYPEETAAVLKELGYRYGVRKTQISYNPVLKTVSVTIIMENNGTAPLYFDWNVCIYALDEDGNRAERFETNLSLPQLAQGESDSATVQMDLSGWTADGENEIPVFAVGIENPETGEPEIALDMQTQHDGLLYLLNP